MTQHVDPDQTAIQDVLQAVLFRATECAINSSSDVLGIGTDIVEISRIWQDKVKWGDRFLTRVFTQREITYCNGKHSPAHHFAGKLAIKEATYKALRLRWKSAFSWTWIEVLNDDWGVPVVRFRGDLETLARSKRGQALNVSVSHAGDFAVAVAVLALDGREHRT